MSTPEILRKNFRLSKTAVANLDEYMTALGFTDETAALEDVLFNVLANHLQTIGVRHKDTFIAQQLTTPPPDEKHET